MEKEQSRNFVTAVLSVLLICAVVWAVIAQSTASKRMDELTQKQQELDRVTKLSEEKQLEAEKVMADAEKKVAEAESLRKVALKWTLQRQQQLQQEKLKAQKPPTGVKAPAHGKTPVVKKAVSKGTAGVKTSTGHKTTAHKVAPPATPL